ncbi:L-rhamnose mutarotase [Bryocella elongata]|uniref:L-rhamnose mutarotase n=1 Tax=Bryocella elongata TaxID=863522 RepID=A0A1H5XZC1_9BACT|nr:L-rhamnose mutarotase [Bryocella elongata]SEG16885.1 L-rhamnose mutarotase [Bryocella elongata]
MNRYCMALDLKDDPELITEYRRYHANVWPEIRQSILAAGIHSMEIYLTGNRLFMIMETEDNFSFERKAAMDAGSPAVQRWEELMWQFQQALPGSEPGVKWRPMDLIFHLEQQPVLS